MTRHRKRAGGPAVRANKFYRAGPIKRTRRTNAEIGADRRIPAEEIERIARNGAPAK